jgi:hypothetical protein
MTTHELQYKLISMIRTCADRDLLERAVKMLDQNAPVVGGAGKNGVSHEAVAKAREEMMRQLRMA